VNSCFLFEEADIGLCGRNSDTGALKFSSLANKLDNGLRDKLLGPNGMVIGDAGTGCRPWLLTPVDQVDGQSLTKAEEYFNFCLSSTRIVIEQVFGIWKNRWRILLRETKMDHENFVTLLTATIVLHNMCEIHKTGYDFNAEDAVLAYMKRFDQGKCPTCKMEYGRNYKAFEEHGTRCPHQMKWPLTKPNPETNGEAKAYRDQLIDELWARKGKGV
jgi:hypothetical protein